MHAFKEQAKIQPFKEKAKIQPFKGTYSTRNYELYATNPKENAKLATM
jgi:hypothetical protein